MSDTWKIILAFIVGTGVSMTICCYVVATVVHKIIRGK